MITEKKVLELVKAYRLSDEYKQARQGEAYFYGEHDILKRKRMAIGEDGILQEVDNLPNNRIVDNQFRRLVKQKLNYFLSKPFTLHHENAKMLSEVSEVLGYAFMKVLRSAVEKAYTQGKTYLIAYMAEGSLLFFDAPCYEVKVVEWVDPNTKNRIKEALRFYDELREDFNGKKTVTVVEHYATEFFQKWEIEGEEIKLVEKSPNFVIKDGLNSYAESLSYVPIFPIRYQNSGASLLANVKCLQDALNTLLSDFQNVLQEDPRSQILIIENYDGEDLGEFRRNLITYGAVKVQSGGDLGRGDVRSLKVEVNAANYNLIEQLLKRAIIENGFGFDAKDIKSGTAPNQLHLKTLMNDMETDANGLEFELQPVMKNLIEFVLWWLRLKGKDFEQGKSIELIFNRDVLVNESEAIDNCLKSLGVLSKRSVLAQHPWVKDVNEELEELRKEQESELDYEEDHEDDE